MESNVRFFIAQLSHHKLLKTCLCFFLALGSHAQTSDGLRISLKGGALYSGINDLETTLLSEPFFLNYSLNKQKRLGFTGGLGINWELKNSIASLNLDVLFAQQGSELVFNNWEKDFNYTLKFNYRYLNLPLLLKV